MSPGQSRSGDLMVWRGRSFLIAGDIKHRNSLRFHQPFLQPKDRRVLTPRDYRNPFPWDDLNCLLSLLWHLEFAPPCWLKSEIGPSLNFTSSFLWNPWCTFSYASYHHSYHLLRPCDLSLSSLLENSRTGSHWLRLGKPRAESMPVPCQKLVQ